MGRWYDEDWPLVKDHFSCLVMPARHKAALVCGMFRSATLKNPRLLRRAGVLFDSFSRSGMATSTGLHADTVRWEC